MSSPTAGPVSRLIREQVAQLLDKRRVVVRYDGERAFGFWWVGLLW